MNFKNAKLERKNLITELTKRWRRLRILIVGDASLSKTFYVRQSLSILHSHTWQLAYELEGKVGSRTFCQDRPGSAGKIAAHARSLGAQVALYSIIGDDCYGETLKQLLRDWDVSPNHLIIDESRPTVVRHRLYGTDTTEGSHLLRFDQFCKGGLSKSITEKLKQSINAGAQNINCIIVADFGIGCITNELFNFLIGLAKDHDIPLILYPSRDSAAIYRTALSPHHQTPVALCPNIEEAKYLAGATYDSADLQKEENRCILYSSLLEQFGLFNIFAVRCGQQGLALVERSKVYPRIGSHFTINAYPVIPKSINAVGRGVIFVASFAVSLSGGFNYLEAAAFANFAANLQSQKKAEDIIKGEEIVGNITTGILPSTEWQEKVLIGGKEFQEISNILQDLVTTGAIYLNSGVPKYPSSSGILPIVTVAQQSVDLISGIQKLMQSRPHSGNILLLLYGESRSGKSELAHSLHYYFERRGIFRTVHCNRDNIEIVLKEIKACKEGDTLLLDELGQEAASDVRDKLVDILDELRKAAKDIIVIATTSIPPEKIKNNDVFKRFRGPFEIPPIRYIKGNIPYLIVCAAKKWNDKPGHYIHSISEGALRLLMTYDYPNNFADLENFTTHMFDSSTEGYIRLQHLPDAIRKAPFGEEDGIDIRFVF